MRKPPARKFALTLIILHFLASFIPYTEDDAPFFINMWNFFKKVFVDSRTFINMGAGRPADAFLHLSIIWRNLLFLLFFL